MQLYKYNLSNPFVTLEIRQKYKHFTRQMRVIKIRRCKQQVKKWIQKLV